MVQLIGRKLLTLLLFIPLLSMLGFFYATTHPANNVPTAANPAGVVDASYLTYVQNALGGDLGTVGSAPIREIVAQGILNSLVLLALTMLLTFFLGPMVGFLSVSRRTRRIRPLALVITTAGQSLPGFFLGVAIIALMIYGILSFARGRIPLPLSGFGLDEHLILPVLVLATGPMLQVGRVTANLLENELQQDYIRVARSKGLSWQGLYWRHAFPNIVAAVIMTIGRSTRWLISGLIVVESLFLWPGIGRIFTFAVGIRIDGREPVGYFLHPELLAILVVIFGLGLLLADFVTSVLAYWSDPRLNKPAEA
ncbi:MAG: ABC transporter permease [Ardenticatenaceae bacterium]|nr:ABC transporter permease [Anaerolineales bacterium]MCB8917592.1 ABC transporter permease [Ardenticatenaceae bacterium]